MKNKRVISSIVLLCILLFFLFGCGNNMVIDGKERKTIGIVNLVVNDPSIMEPKYPDIKYRVIWGNVIWGAILCETIIAPIYFFGFSMFEPIGLRED